jgi:hypothetical protein
VGAFESAVWAGGVGGLGYRAMARCVPPPPLHAHTLTHSHTHLPHRLPVPKPEGARRRRQAGTVWECAAANALPGAALSAGVKREGGGGGGHVCKRACKQAPPPTVVQTPPPTAGLPNPRRAVAHPAPAARARQHASARGRRAHADGKVVGEGFVPNLNDRAERDHAATMQLPCSYHAATMTVQRGGDGRGGPSRGTAASASPTHTRAACNCSLAHSFVLSYWSCSSVRRRACPTDAPACPQRILSPT